jgi:hypothetical protein
MTDHELEEARDAAEQICKTMNEVLDGHQIGHIIPALIFALASMHDNEVMPKEDFVAEIAKGLMIHINEFEQDKKGELQWLQ